MIGEIIEGRFQAGDLALELVDFFEPKEYFVIGTIMVKRAKELNANLGQIYAGFMLDNEFRIPKEWRDFDLVFPKATHEIDHNLYILYLHCHINEQWYRGYGLVEFDWTQRARLVRICN